MAGHNTLATAVFALLAWEAGMAWADPAPSNWSGVPAQVIPRYPETGAPAFTTPTGTGSFTNGQGSAADSGMSTGSSGGTYTGGGGAAMTNMMAQSYGQTAYATAQQLGNNPDAVAGIGQIESGFRNVATANGSSSATGPWQITSGTWGDYVNRYNLPYSVADRTNPEAQAVVANYIIRDYAASVTAVTGQPATVQQAYGAYVFGPTAGGSLANASPIEPLSNYVSAPSLANNNMTGWTVGQFYGLVGSKIGPVATQTVRA
jgi:hypothetical protein